MNAKVLFWTAIGVAIAALALIPVGMIFGPWWVPLLMVADLAILTRCLRIVGPVAWRKRQ